MNNPIEVTDEKKQENLPEVIASRSIDASPNIVTISSEEPEQEKITVLGPEGVSQQQIRFGQQMTEEDKARAVMNPFKEEDATPTEKGTILKPGPAMTDIPGVKEVHISEAPQPYKGMQVSNPEQLKNFNAKQFFKEMIKGGMINNLIRKYDLGGINLEEERKLIEQKQSRLSASKRKAVIALCNMRKQQKQLMAQVATSFLGKADPSKEELEALLDSIEDNVTDTTQAAKIVASEIAEKAQERMTGSVNEVLKESEVNYVPPKSATEDYQEQLRKICAKDNAFVFICKGNLPHNNLNDLRDIKDPAEGNVYYYETIPDEEDAPELNEVVFLDNEWKCIKDGQLYSIGIAATYIPETEKPKQEESDGIPVIVGD